jgi:hypothetical protein
VVKIPRAGYEETVVIPKAERNVVEVAVTSAVGSGSLWLLSGPASILEEKIPTGILTDAARLLPPPLPNEAIDVLPGTLPEAWQGDETTAVAISAALSQKAGETLPLSVVSEAINGAIQSRYLETTLDSGPWPCELSGSQAVQLRVSAGKAEVLPPTPPQPVQPGVRVGEAELKLNEIQDLAEVVGDLKSVVVGLNLKVTVRIELSGDQPPSDDIVEKVNRVLSAVSKDIRLR